MSREVDAPGVRVLAVDNLGRGAVTVQPGEDDRVTGRIECRDADYLEETWVRQVGDQLQISFPRQRWNPPEVYLDLRVPDGIAYRIATGSADIRIGAQAERSTLTSGSGDIQVVGATDLSAKSGSGSITAAELLGHSAELITGSGDIAVERSSAPVQARSASGDVTIRSLGAELRATSSSGDISVPSTTSSVDLRTASGDLRIGVSDGLPAWLDLSSVSGSIEIGLDADHAPEEGEPYLAVRARTASGDIAVVRA